MPSAFAKLEKQTSTEVPDPVKQVLTVVEKKVRNLEKRKGKLDAYKHDHESGKELNEDQKNAIKKYDLVVELLEFAKELQKSFMGIVQENIKLQKKAAKREQVEKQQQETQRIKELLLLQDILVNMGTPEIRNDFLHGTNGALQLDEENLNHLDEFYKLTSPDRCSEENVHFEEQISSAAEHLACLIDGKNKEVLNTTYKNIKELMMKINDCGYFSPATEATNADDSGEECVKMAEEEFGNEVPTGVTEIVRSDHRTEEEAVDSTGLSSASHSSLDTPFYSTAQKGGPSRPLQEVLPVQGSLDFLQDSQIDLQSLHMDPAVVVAHPMMPPTSIGYPVAYHSGSNLPSQDIQTSQTEIGLVGHSAIASVVSPQQQQQMQGAEANNAAMSLPQPPLNPGQDYDAVCPIQTQTYTNQNFAAVHPIVPVTVPGNYVADTLGHPSLQQMVPVGLVPQHVSRTLLTPQTSDAHSMPIASQASGIVPTNVSLNVSNQSEGKEFEPEFQMQQEPMDNGSGASRFGTSSEFQQVDESQDYSGSQQQNFAQNRGYATVRGGRGTRARGPANGYTRSNNVTNPSRGNYGNGRSGYQNTGNYYQGSYAGRDNFNNNATNYSNAYKQRGSARGGGVPALKAVNPGSRGGSNNGRGGYRSQ